jgi:hypothetical protein
VGKDERTIRRWERTRLAPAVSVGADGVHRFDVPRHRRRCCSDVSRAQPIRILDQQDILYRAMIEFSQGTMSKAQLADSLPDLANV